jgi:Xaa-Pro dipeptidase
VHLAYCQAAGAREEELPYNNIIGYGRHAAVLHYQLLDRERAPGVKSFLIDAGAQHAGYACDITRTYSAEPGEFLDLIRSVDAAQQKLVGRVQPGTDYREIHLEAHRSVAVILVTHGIVSGTAEAAVESGLTSVFFPHGVGHLLGIMVHDASGFAAAPAGGTRAKPEGHPYLRLTRDLEPGFVVTIEPGIYFIDMLLDELKDKGLGPSVNWEQVERFKPYGGIRIEDDVVCTEGAPRNLTREGFAATV